MAPPEDPPPATIEREARRSRGKQKKKERTKNGVLGLSDVPSAATADPATKAKKRTRSTPGEDSAVTSDRQSKRRKKNREKAPPATAAASTSAQPLLDTSSPNSLQSNEDILHTLQHVDLSKVDIVQFLQTNGLQKSSFVSSSPALSLGTKTSNATQKAKKNASGLSVTRAAKRKLSGSMARTSMSTSAGSTQPSTRTSTSNPAHLPTHNTSDHATLLATTWISGSEFEAQGVPWSAS
jgi:hypothetical protein